RVQSRLDVLAPQGELRRVERALRRLVVDEVAEARVLLLADRLLETDGELRHPQDLAHLARRHLELLGDLLGVRLAAEALHELALDVHDLVQLLDHVDRDADRARLVGDRARHGLPDPPGRVGRELVALPVVELLDRADEAEASLLDEVEEAEAAAEVALRDRDDEAEVRLDHLRLRRHVAALDALREGDLLVGGQEGYLADLAEVEAEAVERRLDGEVELRRRELVLFRLRLLVRVRLVLLAFDELDVVVDQVGVEVLDLLFRELDVVEPVRDLVVGEEPLFRTVGDELLQLFDVGELDLDGEQLWHHDLRLVLNDSDDEPDTHRGPRTPPRPPTKQAREHSPVLQIRKERRRSHELRSRRSSPTCSPRLFVSATTCRAGRSTPSRPTTCASAGPSGRAAPSSAFSARPTPFVVPAQRSPSAPPF